MPNMFPYKFPAILRYLDTILKDGFIFLSTIVCVKPSNFSMFRSILCPKTYTSLSEIYFNNPSLTKTSMAVLTICFWTPNISANSVSVGIFVPGYKSPSSISILKISLTCWVIILLQAVFIFRLLIF